MFSLPTAAAAAAEAEALRSIEGGESRTMLERRTHNRDPHSIVTGGVGAATTAITTGSGSGSGGGGGRRGRGDVTATRSLTGLPYIDNTCTHTISVLIFIPRLIPRLILILILILMPILIPIPIHTHTCIPCMLPKCSTLFYCSMLLIQCHALYFTDLEWSPRHYANYTFTISLK